MGLNIVNDTNTIKLTNVAGQNNPTTIISKANIVRVGSYWQQNAVNGMGQTPYGYGKRTPGRTTKTIICIELQHGESFAFDCDEVLNQAGWHGCTFVALQQAITDINSWL